jgi:hypothetical protein
MSEVFYVAVKKDGEWIPNILELGILKGDHIPAEIFYALHVNKPWLAYKLMTDLKEENPDSEYKIFKSVNQKFDSTKEFDLEPLLEWYNDKK